MVFQYQVQPVVTAIRQPESKHCDEYVPELMLTGTLSV